MANQLTNNNSMKPLESKVSIVKLAFVFRLLGFLIPLTMKTREPLSRVRSSLGTPPLTVMWVLLIAHERLALKLELNSEHLD
jgi:hypothetical protein